MQEPLIAPFPNTGSNMITLSVQVLYSEIIAPRDNPADCYNRREWLLTLLLAAGYTVGCSMKIFQIHL